MKILLLVICVAFAGCGAKSNEEIAKDLITEKLKTSLPDFNKYESLNFGTLGLAALPYEETELCKSSVKKLNGYRDSLAGLEKIIKADKAAVGGVYNEQIRQLQDSIKIVSERNSEAKQAYTPEKLYRMTHAYTLKNGAGEGKRTEDEFYIDKDFKKVVKMRNLN